MDFAGSGDVEPNCRQVTVATAGLFTRCPTVLQKSTLNAVVDEYVWNSGQPKVMAITDDIVELHYDRPMPAFCWRPRDVAVVLKDHSWRQCAGIDRHIR